MEFKLSKRFKNSVTAIALATNVFAASAASAEIMQWTPESNTGFLQPWSFFRYNSDTADMIIKIAPRGTSSQFNATLTSTGPREEGANGSSIYLFETRDKSCTLKAELPENADSLTATFLNAGCQNLFSGDKNAEPVVELTKNGRPMQFTRW